MTESYKGFLTISIWFTIGMFCLRCFISRTEIVLDFSWYNMYGYAGEAIAFSVLIILLYVKLLWRINPLEKTPRLKKEYIGVLTTTYKGNYLEKEVKLHIQQTLLNVNLILVTDESRSNSITASISKIHNEWKLIYCYMNVPNANVRKRSEIHYGTAMLSVDNVQKLTGHYYTDRKTTGDMNFCNVKNVEK